MRINPYLSFDNCCRVAFEFYAKTFHGEIAMIMSRGESPMADQVRPSIATVSCTPSCRSAIRC